MGMASKVLAVACAAAIVASVSAMQPAAVDRAVEESGCDDRNQNRVRSVRPLEPHMWDPTTDDSSRDSIEGGGQLLEFTRLPTPEEAGRAFLTPKPDREQQLPAEPVYLTVDLGAGKIVKYWYAPDDTVWDLYKYVSERTKIPTAEIDGFQLVNFNAIGRTYVPIPFSETLTLREVPILAGDELQCQLAATVNATEITVTPNPMATHHAPIPGFFSVGFKVAGMPMLTVPIPRM